MTPSNVLSALRFNETGLIPAIAVDHQTDAVLMMAWMNPEAIERSIETGHAHYFSRSRQTLWHKGEQSGHFQEIKSLHLDCDGDVLLLKVQQVPATPAARTVFIGNILMASGRKPTQ